MFFVLRKRHIAAILGGLAFCIIFPAILWGGAAVTTAFGPDTGETAAVVVIDAGHGGADGGAVAADGTVEAQINLAVALRLEQLLQLAGVETEMVRREDISIHSQDAKTLRQMKVSDIHNRVALINGIENSILISIHQNSLPQVKSVHGAQVFYNTVDGAAQLANTVQQALNASVNPGNEKTEKAIDASVYLMKHIQSTGILVECGFLSNAQETEQLKDPSYQTKLALTIAAGYLNHETTEDKAIGEYEE